MKKMTTQDIKIGSWLSAALEDGRASPELKEDLENWFKQFERLDPDKELKYRCGRCDIDLVEEKALENTVEVGIPDFSGQTKDMRGQTLSMTGLPIMISVWKCPKCGYLVK